MVTVKIVRIWVKVKVSVSANRVRVKVETENSTCHVYLSVLDGNNTEHLTASVKASGSSVNK